MEAGTGSSLSSEKRVVDSSTSADEGKKTMEKRDVTTTLFVNHAAIAWDENRRKWTSGQAQRSQRMTTDPIISWTTTYDELLSNNEPFSKPIPLSEMVDFLVDIWQDEGLFD